MSVSTSGSTATLTNTCNQQIFVIWCGDQKWSNKRCGDGPNGAFYTHLDNLFPGKSLSIVLNDNGTYQYGACTGGISFGNAGEYKDFPNGGYSCFKTGRYRNQ